MKLILFIIAFLTILFVYYLNCEKKETFDYVGKHLWYKDPYSIELWWKANRKHDWWNIFHRRQFMNIDGYMYTPL